MGTFAAGMGLGAVAVLLLGPGLDNEAVLARHPPELPPSTAIAVSNPTAASSAISLAEIREIPSEFEQYAALHDLLRTADAGVIEALLEEAGQLQMDWPNGILHSRYLEVAPQAAVNHLLAKGWSAWDRVTHALLAWAKRDLDAALAFANTLGYPLRTREIVNILNLTEGLSEARKDELARQFSVESRLLRTRATAEAAHDPEGAWQKGLAMDPGWDRTHVLYDIADRWFEQDPAKALRALASVSEDTDWQHRQIGFLERWADMDLEAALGWSLLQPPSEQRARLVAAVAALGAKDSPAEMLEIAQTLEPEERREVAKRVLLVWAEFDAPAAIQALEEMEDAQLTWTARQRMVNSWTQSDPLAAFEWALALPATEDRMQMLELSLVLIASSDPLQAASLAGDLAVGERLRAINTVLRLWVGGDPRAAAVWLDASPHKTPATVKAVVTGLIGLNAQEALEWLQEQSVEAQRQSVPVVFRRLANDSPELGLRLLEGLVDPSARTLAATSLVRKWIEENPRTAVRAIPRMDVGARPRLYQAAFDRWAQLDLDRATAATAQIPPSYRDAAILGVLQRAVLLGYSQSAERLFDRIVDPEVRSRAATAMYTHLRQTDPQRAARYREM